MTGEIFQGKEGGERPGRVPRPSGVCSNIKVHIGREENIKKFMKRMEMID